MHYANLMSPAGEMKEVEMAPLYSAILPPVDAVLAGGGAHNVVVHVRTEYITSCIMITHLGSSCRHLLPVHVCNVQTVRTTSSHKKNNLLNK